MQKKQVEYCCSITAFECLYSGESFTYDTICFVLLCYKEEKGSADDIKEDTKKDSKSDNFSPKRSERSERSVTKTDSSKT